MITRMLKTVCFTHLLRIFLLINICFNSIYAQLPTKAHYKPGELIVMLEPNISPPSRWQVHPQSAILVYEKMLSARMNIHLYSYNASRYSGEALLKYTRNMAEVVLAQFNHYIELRGKEEVFPDDPQFSGQWNLHNTGQNGASPGADVDAPEAWEIATGGLSSHGDTLVIAMIDEGIDLVHDDLVLWKNRREIPENNIDDDGNGYIDDYDGWNGGNNTGLLEVRLHGTHVAGIIAARGNNGKGVSGVNWNTQLMPLQGSSQLESIVIASYGYVLEMRKRYNETQGEQGAFVVATNSSFGVNNGLPEDFPIWCALYDSLGHAGILNAGATANAAIDVEQNGDIPTRCLSDFLIGVTNTTFTDLLNSGAAYGATSIDLGAPGTQILSTIPNQAYGVNTGTSMSTPHVAGAIGLLLSAACPNLIAQYKNDPASVALLLKSFILEGVDTIPSLENRTTSGGRLNLYKSLVLVQEYCNNLSDCIIPYGLRVTQRLDTSVRLNWNESNAAISYELRYKAIDTPEWTSIRLNTNFFDLTGLTACTSYEFQLRTLCVSDSSIFSSSRQFSTEGCCDPPVMLQAMQIQNTSAQLNWRGVFAAKSYELQYRMKGAAGWTSTEVVDTTYSFSPLIACTEYEVRIRTLCNMENSAYSDTLEFRSLGCGLCIDADYCESWGINSSNEWIQAVEIGPIKNESGNDYGFGDFSMPFYDLRAGVNYAIKLTPGFSSFPFSEYWRIWIDLNRDGDFDEEDELVFDPGDSNTGIVEGRMSLPLSLDSGNTRMRVSIKFISQFGGGNPPGACERIEFGEVEDYCVNISVDSSFCAVPTNLSSTSVSETEATLSWDGRFNTQNYLLRLRETGTPNWTEVSDTSKSYLATNLRACSSYEWQLAAQCQGDSTSEFSELETFSTRGCGACLDRAYCPSGGNASDEWIDLIQIDSFTFQTGASGGYGDFTSENLQLSRGANYDLKLAPGFSGSSFLEYWRVWVDWNQDGIFELEDELAYDAGQGLRDPVSGELVIPTDAPLGLTRMRVSMKFIDALSGGTPPTPCEAFNFGEVEDYCMTITPAVGMDDPLEAQLQIYPNPFGHQLHIQTQAAIQQVEIRNILGEVVLRKAGSLSSRMDLNVEGLASGTYMMQVVAGNKRGTRMVVKE